MKAHRVAQLQLAYLARNHSAHHHTLALVLQQREHHVGHHGSGTLHCRLGFYHGHAAGTQLVLQLLH